MQGGGGPLLTDTIDESKAYNCHPELDSGSIQRCELPVSLDRFRNKFGMTLAEPVLQLNPSANSTKDSTVHCHREGVSPWRSRQKCSVIKWIATPARPARNDRGRLTRTAFTMAEILLSLTIIGVVAAITLPSLTGNINERTWNTQRKALYARMSQAIALMPALNGYGTLRETTDSAGSTSIEDTAAETFVTAGLSKVLKINNICDSGHLPDCGITSKFTTLAGSAVDEIPTTMGELNSTMINNSTADVGTGSSYSVLDTKVAAFETQNGESILLFYNPACVSNMGETGNYYAQPKICVNMVYDLNSSKGPNTIGKDMGFLTILYPSDSVVVAPMPFNGFFDGVNDDNASSICTTNAGEDYRIPTRDELASIFVNKNLLGLNWGSSHLYSSTKFQANWGIVNWVMVLSNGQFRLPNSTSNWGTLCVKRN